MKNGKSNLLYKNYRLAIKSSLSAILMVVFFPTGAQQFQSKLGRFQADNIRGCAPLTVNITNKLAGDCTTGKPCVMDYMNNGNLMQNQFTYTYNQEGTYTLLVLYQSIGYDTIVVKVDKNIAPDYEIYSCNGNKAIINVTDRNFEQYSVDFGDMTTPRLLTNGAIIETTPHNYSIAETYLTGVRGINSMSKDNCATKTKTFTSLLTIPPPTIDNLVSLEQNKLALNFEALPNINYHLEMAQDQSVTFNPLDNIYEANIATIENLNLDKNYYCYRLNAFDPCIKMDNYSNIVCSSIFSVTPQSDLNSLNWKTGNLAQVSNFIIAKNTSNIELSGTTYSFDDSQVECKTNYCYQIITLYNNGSKSISLEKCVTSFSTKIPDMVDNVSSTNLSTKVNLSWLSPTNVKIANYTINRSVKNKPLEFFDTSTSIKFTDESYNLNENICYQINSTSQCDVAGNIGIGFCPIILKAELVQNKSVNLEWTSYSGWKKGVLNYSVEKYRMDGTLIKRDITNTTNWTDDLGNDGNQQFYYQIVANPIESGVEISTSNQVTIEKQPIIFSPSAFTPNNDNLNDTFIISGINISKLTMGIFDRWGNLVYFTDNNVPWDGQSKGKELPPSTYIWKAEITDMAGKRLIREGTVSLLRN